MTGDQREKWRQALAARHRQQRNQRGRRPRGIATVTRAGMIRVPPPQDDPAPDGATPKEDA